MDAVVVRQGKNLKGRLLEILLVTGGKYVLRSALAKTVKARRGPGRPAEAGTVMSLAYDVFVNDPPPQDGFLPNGEPKRFSPMASTLIYGERGRGAHRSRDDRRPGSSARRLGAPPGAGT